MADVNQTMQLTLSAKDEASEVLKRVHGELEKLGAGVSLADLSQSLDAVSSHLQAVEHAGSGLVGQLHDLTRVAADAGADVYKLGVDGTRLSQIIGDVVVHFSVTCSPRVDGRLARPGDGDCPRRRHRCGLHRADRLRR
jgi:hypothetical protein